MNSKSLAHDRLKRMCGSSSFTKTKVRHNPKKQSPGTDEKNPTSSSANSFNNGPHFHPRCDRGLKEEMVRQVDAIIASEAHVIESALELCQKIDLAIGVNHSLLHS